MKLNIGPVLKNEGSALNIDSGVDFGRLDYLGAGFDFREPVRVTGRVRSIGGTLELKGRIDGHYFSSCDLCGKPVEGDISVDFDETLNSETEDYDSECFSLNGTVLDISGLINSLVWENLPMRLLCREDCKGLCGICGCDLNETVCNCDRTVYDPRFAIFNKGR